MSFWSLLRTHGPEVVREVWPEIRNHAWTSVPQLFRSEVREAIREKVLAKYAEKNRSDCDLHPPPPMPDFSKANPWEGTTYVFDNSTPFPDFTTAFLPKEPNAPPPPSRSLPVDSKCLFSFGGGVGVGVTLGYLIWGRGGGGN